MSRRITNCLVSLAGCAGLMFSSLPAFAATVTLVGDNFDLSYDDTQVGLAIYGVPIYGPGTNSIFFNQNGFEVLSTDGDNNPEGQASTVGFTLTRHDDSFNFETLNLLEFGNYTLSGPGASVNLSGNMSVSTPAGLFGPIVDPLPQIAATSDLTINDGGAHNWFGGAFTDLTQEGLFFGQPNDFTAEDAITISITNILTANTSSPASSAFIQKLQSGAAVQLGVNGVPATSSVPVPAAVWLMGSGLLGLFGVARRKKAA